MPSISKTLTQITILHFELALYGGGCVLLGFVSSGIAIDSGNWFQYSVAALTGIVVWVQWQIITDTFRTIRALHLCGR